MEENRELDQAVAVQLQLRRRLPLWAKLSISGLLIVAVTCIGLVATLVVPNVVVVRKLVMTSRVKAKVDISVISDGVNRYVIDNQGRLPDSLQVLLREESGKQYLDFEAIPRDPWGHPYGYEPPGSGGKAFRVFSLGKDGRPGGVGEDQDIDNLLIKEGKI